MNRILSRRLSAVLILLAGFIIVVMLRLAWVQLVMRHKPVPGRSYTLEQMARLQGERELVLDDGRGRLLDRNGRPLAGETVWSPVLFPLKERLGAERGPGEDEDAALRKLAALLHTDYETLQKRRESLSQPLAWPDTGGKAPLALSVKEAEDIAALCLDGVEVLPCTRRYKPGPSGGQWLGHVSENMRENGAEDGSAAGEGPDTGKGGGAGADKVRVPVSGTTGLERSLEPLLRGIGPTEAYASVDARGRRIDGTPITARAPRNPYYPLSFTTTVDGTIQAEMERLLAEAGVKEGAVVVLDAANGDVVAMASSPFYDPEAVSPEGGEWANRALQAAAPGSVFKIVTAAAALEAGVTSPGEPFECMGDTGRFGLSCPADHGRMTLSEAFARSCNGVFAELAGRVSGGQLEAAAFALGLGREIGWKQPDVLGMKLLRPLQGEQAGAVFHRPGESDEGIRVQTAIGQRDVRITPLQAANLVVTLLHGGEVHAPRIVSRVSFANGQKLRDFKEQRTPYEGGALSPAVCRAVLAMMRGVVAEGTGRSLQDAAWPLAGKSGTAQTAVDGKPLNHQWFVGYGPVHAPRYAVAVTVLNEPVNARPAALPLFERVMNNLAGVKPAD